ncbi:hypothetical protein Hypma_004251 [Hypsizygus marmoreus]|uniref:Uncharacterized protein n=1 Tax=Hypsizygus marmoreus TaxID=39966 RepID=A0A369J260_HYPMA|nr:hypothetical protein Hypma_004251 [Hypsizygus marmoreus]
MAMNSRVWVLACPQKLGAVADCITLVLFAFIPSSGCDSNNLLDAALRIYTIGYQQHYNE